MILVDSSVWIDFFRGTTTPQVETLDSLLGSTRLAVGDLILGGLTPEDVVDAVLLRAYREFVKKPAGREIGSWLIQLATEQLQAEVKRLKSNRDRAMHIEEDIPETPPVEAVTTLGDEILDFFIIDLSGQRQASSEPV